MPVLPQKPPAQGEHFACWVAAVQACPMWPFTVFVVHAEVPAQTSPVAHVSSGVFLHENVQVDSHPVPGPLALPKSQSSPGSTMPSPQAATVHVMLSQYFPLPQSSPSPSGVGAVHACVSRSHKLVPAQESPGDAHGVVHHLFEQTPLSHRLPSPHGVLSGNGSPGTQRCVSSTHVPCP